MKFYQKVSYIGSILLILLGGQVSASKPEITDQLTQAEVYKAMKFVSDWQWSKFDKKTNLFVGYEDGAHMNTTSWDTHPQGWVYAALHVGMTKWAKLADAHGDESYFRKLYDIGKRNKYLLASRIYNADDYAIGQLYLDLYEKYQEPEMLVPLKVVFDIILNSPSTVSLEYKHIQIDANADKYHNASPTEAYGGREIPVTPCKNRWCWADALFMGPPVWMHLAKVTGDSSYLNFANKEFWETANLLWDKEDHLFFRDTRFFDRREDNGEKVILGSWCWLGCCWSCAYFRKCAKKSSATW